MEFFFTDSEDQSIERIKAWNSLKQNFFLTRQLILATKPNLTNSDPYIYINAFRLAALQNKLTLLRYLLEILKEKYQLSLESVDPQEKFGWNLAHFLALNSRESFPLSDLPEIKALCQRPNKAGATPLDFVVWLSEPEETPVSAFGKEHASLTSQQFLRLTNSKYWIRPRFTSGAVLRLGFEQLTLVFKITQYLSSLLSPKIHQFLDQLKSQSCKLKMKKMVGANVPPPLQGQWECLSSEFIPIGGIVAVYSGTVLHTLWSEPIKEGNK